MARYKRPKLKKGEEYCLKVTRPAIRGGRTNGGLSVRGWPRTVQFKKVYLVDLRTNGRAVVMEVVTRWKSPNGVKPAMMDPDKFAHPKTLTYEVNQAHLIAPWADWEAGPKEKRNGVMEMAGT